MADEKCAHGACECNVSEGQTYCSDYCREHADHQHDRCGCGHPDCA